MPYDKISTFRSKNLLFLSGIGNMYEETSHLCIPHNFNKQSVNNMRGKIYENSYA